MATTNVKKTDNGTHDKDCDFLSAKLQDIELFVRNLERKVTGSTSQAQDIKEVIQNIYDYLDNIISLSPGTVYWLDRDNVYLGCNNEHLADVGLKSREDIIGKTNFDLPWAASADNLNHINNVVMSTGQPIIAEESGIIASGACKIVLTKKAPLYGKSGEITGIIGLSIDITERKKAEEELLIAKERAEAANQAKTEFLENMRHDIRTPLSGIIGFASLLKDVPSLPKAHEYADNLVASSNALLNFLNEVLEAIKVASGELPILKKKFDLKAKFSDVLKLNQAKAAQKKLEFFLDFSKKVPQYVVGDPTRLQRIFLELVNNALNFTHEGNVKASVNLAKENGQDIVIKLVIEDTGIGIPKDKQEEIFTRFKRLTPSFQGIYKGAGLGLTIVKQFIDDLHGEIYIESEPEKGSTFTCLIPLQKALLQDDSGVKEEGAVLPQQISTLPTKKAIQTKSKSNNKSNVLLVEDDDFVADITKTILESLDCNVDIACTGEAAIKQACSGNYDILFMDIGLPDIDGYEVTRRIHQCEAGREHLTPIIALSAHSGIDNAKKCISVGMSAVLTKPLMSDKALDILGAFIPSRAQAEKPIEQKNSSQTKNQIINLALVKKEYDNKMIQTIFEIALKDLPGNKKQFIFAYDQKNWKSLQSLTHKIRGTAAYCRAECLQEACGKLDNYLQEKQDPKTITELYNKTLEEIEKFGKYLKSFKKS